MMKILTTSKASKRRSAIFTKKKILPKAQRTKGIESLNFIGLKWRENGPYHFFLKTCLFFVPASTTWPTTAGKVMRGCVTFGEDA